MNTVFKLIKKKSRRRVIGGFWLFLLMIELICPVFGHEAGDIPLNSKHDQNVFSTEKRAKSSENFPSVTTCNERHNKNPFCGDECLCHTTAIPSVNSITIKESVEFFARIPHRYEEAVFNFLPPPFQPPKHS